MKTKSIVSVKLPVIPTTAEGLRDALFDEINALRRGEDTLRRAKVIAQLAHRVIEAARLQLEVSGAIEGKTTRLGALRDKSV